MTAWLHGWVGALALSLTATAMADAQLGLDFERGVEVRDDAQGQSATLWRGSLRWARELSGTGPSRLAAPEIQYEGGTSAQRSARVVVDPTQPRNHVLEFRVSEPNVASNAPGRSGKSRVQMNLYGNESAAELYVSVRLYLDPALAALQQYPRAFDWFTLSEWWNDAPWVGAAHPFRLTVNLVKSSAEVNAPLQLAVVAQAMLSGRRDFHGADLWRVVDSYGRVPFGRWMRLEYYFQEGDATSGRFGLALTVEGDTRRVVFDEARPTVHPASTQRDGLRHLNPVKLYTSAALTNFMAARGAALRLLWDDLGVWACDPVPSGQESACVKRWRSG